MLPESAPYARIGTVAMCNVGKCPSNRNVLRCGLHILGAWVFVADANRGLKRREILFDGHFPWCNTYQACVYLSSVGSL